MVLDADWSLRGGLASLRSGEECKVSYLKFIPRQDGTRSAHQAGIARVSVPLALVVPWAWTAVHARRGIVDWGMSNLGAFLHWRPVIYPALLR